MSRVVCFSLSNKSQTTILTVRYGCGFQCVWVCVVVCVAVCVLEKRFYFSPSLVSLCGGAYPPLAAGIFPPRLKFPHRDAILIAMIRRA
jgi:hypothetical protein